MLNFMLENSSSVVSQQFDRIHISRRYIPDLHHDLSFKGACFLHQTIVFIKELWIEFFPVSIIHRGKPPLLLHLWLK